MVTKELGLLLLSLRLFLLEVLIGRLEVRESPHDWQSLSLLVGLLRLRRGLQKMECTAVLLGGEGHGLELSHPLFADLYSLVLLGLAFDTESLLVGMVHDLSHVVWVNRVEHAIGKLG